MAKPHTDRPETTCSVEDVRQLVAHQLDLLWAHPSLASAIPPLMLWGPPGVGKSTVVREVCAARGIGFLDVRLAQREPIDLRGLPVPRGDTTEWLLSAEWPRDPASRGIILFDELTAADRTLQVAAYELILDRRLGTLYQVPPGWFLMAAGNRASDHAVAGAMSSALANRFCHLEVAPDLDGWLAWAHRKGLHPHVLGLLRLRPALFLDMSGDVERGWPSPRTWERVAVAVAHADALDPRHLRRLVEGLVGPVAAAELHAFRTVAATLPDVVAMLERRAPVAIPKTSNLRHALCAAVAHHLWRVERSAAALETFFDVVLALGPDFATLLFSDALRSATAEQVRAVFAHRRIPEVGAHIGIDVAGRLNRTTSELARGLLAELRDG